MGKRGPKKGHGGRPRGSYSGPQDEDTPFRKAMREYMRLQRSLKRDRKGEKDRENMIKMNKKKKISSK